MTEAHGANVPTTKELARLLDKANKGDTTALSAVQVALDAWPAVWQEYGDLAKTARDSLVRRIAGEKALAQQEMYERKLAAMQQDLAGPTPSFLERLLVERIVLCWLHLYYAEGIYTQNMEEFSIRQAEFQQARISKAQTRYLMAIRTLAQIRRLNVPAVQVNIAEQQVNVAG